MNFIYPIFFILLFIAVYWIQNVVYDRTARKKLNKIKDLGLKLNHTLYSVKCETFISGRGA